MILSVNGDEYKVPEKLTISKWAELQHWTMNDEYLWDKIISILMDMEQQVVEQLPQEIKQTCIFILGSLMFHEDKEPLGNFIDLDKITVGQFIDMEIYISNGIHRNIAPVVEMLFNVEYDPDFSAHQVWGGLRKYFNFRKTIFNRYKVLFNSDRNEEINNKNDKKPIEYVWYEILLILAGGNFLALDDASNQPLISALNFIAYDKDKKNEEINRMKNMRK